jgi:glycosyltransferase involved in cell wall biosynthesis
VGAVNEDDLNGVDEPIAERVGPRPFLTVAIPHYNRRRHLEAVLDSLFAQTFDDFEILVSDDCSHDDSVAIVPAVLERSPVPYRFYAQRRNLDYDRNVRFCLDKARGRYAMLLGNDDALAAPDVLQRIADALKELGYPQAAFANYVDLRSGERFARALRTELLGTGAEAAVSHYRNFSFVSGLIYDAAGAQRLRDELKPGVTTFYQVLIASRLLAAGGGLGAVAVDAIEASIEVDGERGTNWSDRMADAPRSFAVFDNLSGWLLLAVQRGIRPHVPPDRFSTLQRKLFLDSIFFSYARHLFELRVLIRWSYAFGYARSLWPSTLFGGFTDGSPPAAPDRLRIWAAYLVATAAGLTLPPRLLLKSRAPLARAVREVKVRRGLRSRFGRA